jgi:hypothetical protein
MAETQFSFELVSGVTAMAKLAVPRISPAALAVSFMV